MVKLIVYIRADEAGRNITLRLDTKYESLDTPTICRYGRKLADAIEGTADKNLAEQLGK